MINHQEISIKAQEEKSDNMMNSWRHLPKIQQNVINLAEIEEYRTIPEDPTKEIPKWSTSGRVSSSINVRP